MSIPVFILLMLVNLCVLNIAYNGLVAEKGSSILSAIRNNTIFDLWGYGKKNSMLQRVMDDKYGVITGLVYGDNKGTILVNGQVAREGMVVAGVKIVKVNPDSVEFEKNGQRWVRKVGEKR